ncbi:RNA polymerase sigma factor [Bosea sp. Root381]|uniref:RNA polymerase sigma factor n=1 Tax=Bosea sp. Root381 TaxID=1736524 RepID=UPI000ACB98C2|nr:RNA polymerase sigma factor [Bosea sp. Root381]
MQAVERALCQNWERLFSYARRLSGSRDAAADLLQSCALKALSVAPPAEETRIRAWLFAILRNIWIDEYRRSQVSAELGPNEPDDGRWRYDNRLIAEITVRQAFDRLEPPHREILELIELAGFRYAEAAEILDVPVGTVMSRLSRARLSLLEAIEGGNVRALATRRRQAS